MINYGPPYNDVCLPFGLDVSVNNALAHLPLPYCAIVSRPSLAMDDDRVATKAPESDAQEPSILSSGDTPAQTGPTMGVGNPVASQLFRWPWLKLLV